jgi:UDP-N-acetylglucosamine 2-epimerase (non-hydrolysing)
MKIMTVLGTRPEIIRLSLIIKKTDEAFDHVLVHTGQNYAECLNDIFFKELKVRKPDYRLGIKEDSFGAQISRIFYETEKVMIKEKPDRLLILGDTNSGLSAIVAKRLGIPVYHMEAGNRCYDNRVPEEVNRRIIDHSSDILMPYTHRSKENLLREGIQRENIFVIGNPIYEVLKHFEDIIDKSIIFQKLHLEKGKYFLVTMHRAENVDNISRLGNLVKGLEMIVKRYRLPVLCSLHPRTKSRMQQFGFSIKHNAVRYLTPMGFVDFVSLEKNAYCVLTDSGTVQEECSIFRIPNVTIRDVTERPETIECGSNLLSGVAWDRIMDCVQLVLKLDKQWNPPHEYLEPNVSAKVIKILMGFRLSNICL